MFSLEAPRHECVVSRHETYFRSLRRSFLASDGAQPHRSCEQPQEQQYYEESICQAVRRTTMKGEKLNNKANDDERGESQRRWAIAAPSRMAAEAQRREYRRYKDAD